jgi:DNA ligase D-like protein (predicted ligase)
MTDIHAIPDNLRDKLKKKRQPGWVDPMLAQLTDMRFTSDGWIFERKLDGERCLTFRDGKRMNLFSRNRKKLNIHYPELPERLAAQPVERFIVDGEVVAFHQNTTSFARLQGRMHVKGARKARKTGIPIFYYLFDLLYLDRFDLTEVPLRRRKVLLKRAFTFKDPLRYVNHRNREGESFFVQACAKGWEGLIAKKAGAPYVHGRSTRWLKFKCVNRQEMVIGGFTEPTGGRIGFGALLIGFFDGDRLIYAGKVGTGFDDPTLKGLRKRLAAIKRRTSPFDTEAADGHGVHFVTPKLVAEIAFTEWTRDNRLRHPRFLGLRPDKDPSEVVKEEAG